MQEMFLYKDTSKMCEYKRRDTSPFCYVHGPPHNEKLTYGRPN